MRKLFLSLVAAATIGAGALLPSGANALTAGPASSVRQAASEIALVDNVRYVCRHRAYSSRRVCWWAGPRPTYRPYYRPYRPYYSRPYRPYRPYRGYRPYRW